MLSRIQFVVLIYLWLLLFIPVALIFYFYKLRHYSAAIQLSNTEAISKLPRQWKQFSVFGLFFLRMLALAAIIIALARPQSNLRRQDVSVEGIDIVLATDVSTSMMAEDLKPNRLEAAKEVGIEFISSRPDDRIGLVIFSGESFTQCPLTTNHASLINLYRSIGFGMINDGTAIGDGLATAINRLKESKATSKVIILLTDGVNNMGAMDPRSVAEIAEKYAIRIYTIGVATQGVAPVPTPARMQYHPVDIDEDLLKNISSLTGGKYFRATNKASLEQVYKDIDQLERSRIDVTEFSRKREEFLPFALFAAGLLLLEFLLRFLFLKIVI